MYTRSLYILVISIIYVHKFSFSLNIHAHRNIKYYSLKVQTVNSMVKRLVHAHTTGLVNIVPIRKLALHPVYVCRFYIVELIFHVIARICDKDNANLLCN